MSYLPIITEKAQDLMMVLEETEFFEDYEIKDRGFAFDYLCEKLTIKFINGNLEDDGPLFTEDEMEKYLREIIVGSIVSDLQIDGILDSVENEEKEEFLFLTEKGKKYADDLKNNSEFEDLV